MKSPVRWPAPETPAPDLVIERFAPEQTYKTKVYVALKQAIANMDIYSSPEPKWIDERQLSERLGVSRTPVREAVAMLEQEGFVKSLPRRGIMVLRKTQREVVEMIQAWAALESMAARLAVVNATDDELKGLRKLFEGFDDSHKPAEHLGDYSSANIVFHQTIIRISGSKLLGEMTDNLLLHVRGIRQLTIGRDDRIGRSMQDHLGIIEALEKRDPDLAERLSREHTLGLAAYVAAHGQEIFD
ncbi:GntR family transcriptional regulator [Prosthecodimorpha hirschii]|uniref:GntR family transcriptional regulator n=1 Tax=Prosthecodimorpha hirschii TaxID=665126 RepID=UPI001FED3FA6|nr:GntR family transcriptional regulator [Prosthecomicrobium hirschii]